MAFNKESKRKLLSLISANSFIKKINIPMTLGLKFLLCLNENFFISKNLHSNMVFQSQSCETVSKVVCITRMGTDKNYST